MHRFERVLIVAALVASIVAIVGTRGTPVALAQESPNQAVRIATVDIFEVIERIMQQDQYKLARESLSASWDQRAKAIESDLEALENQFKALRQGDPRAEEILRQAQAKQGEYQKLAQQRHEEIDKLSATQLVECFGKTREAARVVAERLGYSHAIANRSQEREIQGTTVSMTLQELLARPIVKGIPSDDITQAVLADLNLPAQSQPQPPSP
jgi:Skp family chaperone for outer membrane proteins